MRIFELLNSSDYLKHSVEYQFKNRLQKTLKPARRGRGAFLCPFICLVKNPDVFGAGYIVKSVETVWS